MLKVLFSLLLLLAFFLSFESLTSDSKEIKLTDEIVWLFNESSILERMDLNHIEDLINNLERTRNELVRDSRDAAKTKQSLADLKNLNPALTKVNELKRALDRMGEVDRNYRDNNPNLTRQTRDYVARTKRESLGLLRDFYKDDKRLVEAFK
jgi:hypothetical protein